MFKFTTICSCLTEEKKTYRKRKIFIRGNVYLKKVYLVHLSVNPMQYIGVHLKSLIWGQKFKVIKLRYYLQ